jgi:hypothetical protein
VGPPPGHTAIDADRFTPSHVCVAGGVTDDTVAVSVPAFVAVFDVNET